MNTFIRAAEVWLPSADRSLLEFGGGAYAAVPYFGAVSRSLCFGRGEGLPGRAWEEGHPIVLQRFDGTYFLRIVAAHAAGLTCAIAVPTFNGGELSAVLVLFCGDRSRQAGAIELWRNDPRVASDMTLVDGYYGAASDALQAVSRDTSLPRGTGLPGLAWQRTESVFMDDVTRSSRFLRAESAAVAGIDRGLAIPCDSQGHASYVLTLLSSAESPLAARIESWVPTPDGSALQRRYGHCEIAGPLPPETLPLHHAGAVGVAYAERRPVIRTAFGTEPAALVRSAVDAQLSALVALPVVSDGQVSEVVVLYS